MTIPYLLLLLPSIASRPVGLMIGHASPDSIFGPSTTQTDLRQRTPCNILMNRSIACRSPATASPVLYNAPEHHLLDGFRHPPTSAASRTCGYLIPAHDHMPDRKYGNLCCYLFDEGQTATNSGSDKIDQAKPPLFQYRSGPDCMLWPWLVPF